MTAYACVMSCMCMSYFRCVDASCHTLPFYLALLAANAMRPRFSEAVCTATYCNTLQHTATHRNTLQWNLVPLRHCVRGARRELVHPCILSMESKGQALKIKDHSLSLKHSNLSNGVSKFKATSDELTKSESDTFESKSLKNLENLTFGLHCNVVP